MIATGLCSGLWPSANNPVAHEIPIFLEEIVMEQKVEQKGARKCNRKCDHCGKMPQSGHHVSHSNIKTKRRFLPNLQIKKFYIPEEDRWVTLRVSTSGIKSIQKKGVMVCIKEAIDKGYIV